MVWVTPGCTHLALPRALALLYAQQSLLVTLKGPYVVLRSNPVSHIKISALPAVLRHLSDPVPDP